MGRAAGEVELELGAGEDDGGVADGPDVGDAVVRAAAAAARRVTVAAASSVLVLSAMRDREAVRARRCGDGGDDWTAVRRIDAKRAHVVRRRAHEPLAIGRASRGVKQGIRRAAEAGAARSLVGHNDVGGLAGLVHEA